VKLWQRALLIIAAAAAIYALVRFSPRGVGSLLIVVCAIWLGRSMYRSKVTADPMGENRDFSLRPVAAAALKAAGCMVAAFFWAVLTGYAIRLGYVSDTWHGAGLLVVPALVFLVVSVMYVGKAMARFQLGGTPPGD
jgi:hypothetical protein